MTKINYTQVTYNQNLQKSALNHVNVTVKTFTASAGYGSLVVRVHVLACPCTAIHAQCRLLWHLAYIDIHASNSTDSLTFINHCLFNFRWL